MATVLLATRRRLRAPVVTVLAQLEHLPRLDSLDPWQLAELVCEKVQQHVCTWQPDFEHNIIAPQCQSNEMHFRHTAKSLLDLALIAAVDLEA